MLGSQQLTGTEKAKLAMLKVRWYIVKTAKPVHYYWFASLKQDASNVIYWTAWWWCMLIYFYS